MLYNDVMLVRLLALAVMMSLVSCQMGARYEDFWTASRTNLGSSSDVISLEKLQDLKASLSIILKNGASNGGQDLTTSLQYAEGKGWCVIEYAAQASVKRPIADKVALSLFQSASQLPCMVSKKQASNHALPLGLSFSYRDVLKGNLSFMSKDCEEKNAAYLDLLIQMRASISPAKPLALSRVSFQELQKAKPSATKMRKLYHLNPLMMAIEIGDENEAAKLMQAAMKTGYILSYVNQTNCYGKTALHYACRAGQGEIVADLLASGASVDLRDNDGTTPMMLATRNGHTEIVQQLIAAGAN